MWILVPIAIIAIAAIAYVIGREVTPSKLPYLGEEPKEEGIAEKLQDVTSDIWAGFREIGEKAREATLDEAAEEIIKAEEHYWTYKPGVTISNLPTYLPRVPFPVTGWISNEQAKTGWNMLTLEEKEMYQQAWWRLHKDYFRSRKNQPIFEHYMDVENWRDAFIRAFLITAVAGPLVAT